MEAGNRKLYAKDMTSVALTTNHKRAVVGAFVEGKLKMYNNPPAKPKENSSSKTDKPSTSSTRGSGRGGRGTRGNDRGRGNRGRGGGGRGGGGGSGKKNQDAKEKEQKKQSRDGNNVRGEQLPLRSNKKLVDRLKDPHVQALIRNQLGSGDVFYCFKMGILYSKTFFGSKLSKILIYNTLVLLKLSGKLCIAKSLI